MKRHHIIVSGLQVPLDAIVFVAAFFISRDLRLKTDLIPGVQLPIQTISDRNLWGFAIAGALLFFFIQAVRKLYVFSPEKSFWAEVLRTFVGAVIWFLVFTALVYLGNGYLYTVEIPRLVIFFSLWIGFFGVVFFRGLVRFALTWLYRLGWIEKTRVVLVGKINDTIRNFYDAHPSIEMTVSTLAQALKRIRNRSADVIVLGDGVSSKDSAEILGLCRIFGISPQLVQLPDSLISHSSIAFVKGFPVTELHFVRISTWGRILKRIIDFCVSCLGIVVLSPIFIIIAVFILIEDPAGPIIYRNRRVGKDGKFFTLYKFRYMYWKYCVKDAYGVDPKADSALKFEQKLIGTDKNSRTGPIYKITQDDPRKMRTGAFIERYSLDELPQLFNVLIGNMSLVGPRPHQPREVEKYDEWHQQVLTIKPGITGMAQVYAREAKDFDKEVKLDAYYIENWSLFLDLKLLLGTAMVLAVRNR